MKMEKSLFATTGRLLKGLAVSALLSSSVNHMAMAAQYTAQEKANMQMVQDFYDALEAADAKRNMGEAIVGIAEKYIAPNYKQHMAGAQSGRDNFVKMFQGRAAATGTGGPPPAAPDGKAPVMEPPKLIALMANGDMVVRVTSRGPMMIWNMFRIENGQLAEHWDPGAGGGAPPAGGPPPSAPPR